jgi:DNA helicase IV
MKMTSFITTPVSLALLALSLTFAAGCKSNDKKESRTETALEETGDAIASDTRAGADKLGDEARKAGDNIKEGVNKAGDKLDQAGDRMKAGTRRSEADFKREREEALANMREEQTKLNARIDNLKADMKRQGNKVNAASREQMAKLEAERKQLGQDMRRAQDATADAWDEVKKGFSRAGDRLKEK